MSVVEKRYQAIWGQVNYDGDVPVYVTIVRLGGHDGWDTLAEAREELKRMPSAGADYPEIDEIEDTWTGVSTEVKDNVLPESSLDVLEDEWVAKGVLSN